MSTSAIQNTINHLRLCREARSAGFPVSYTTDPKWLVNMAINRRAGWPDDPTTTRGSAMPVAGKYPKRAAGDYGYRELQQLADRINSRVLVRDAELGEWKRFIMSRIPHRIHTKEDF